MATGEKTRKGFKLSKKALAWIGAVVALLLVCGGGGYAISNSMSAASETAIANGWKRATATTGTINSTISLTGNIKPQAQASLSFSQVGIITEILVQPGDKVKAGQALARIDSVDAEFQVQQAKASLRQAQAQLADLLDGATPEEIRQAELQVEQSRAQYQQTAGAVTQADIEAARARVAAAQANLNAIQNDNLDEKNAVAAVEQAQIRLQQQRDQLSQAKTNAQLAMEQSANSLAQTQNNYSLAKQNWDYVQETGRDPQNRFTDPTTGKSSNVKVSDEQRQQYYNAFLNAEIALRNAENALQQSQIAFDQARQAEVLGVQSAEQDVVNAQNQLNSLQANGKEQKLASARSELAAAQAALNQLVGAQRAGSLNSANSAIAIAENNLEKLLADPSDSALAQADVAVINAELALQQAERTLDKTTLKAPFDATVARVGFRIGESSAPGTETGSGSIVIANLDTFYIEVPIDELDVGTIKEGQVVNIAIDALPDVSLAGKVTNIEPIAVASSSGTNNYTARIDIDKTDAVLRSGMTAAADIITETKENVVLVPRRAIISEAGKSYVLIPNNGPVDTAKNRPGGELREVTLGLSNSDQIEIVSGLQVGEEVWVQDVVEAFNPLGM
jgi:HlyD family secretion protein